jgi:hypothetical protein
MDATSEQAEIRAAAELIRDDQGRHGSTGLRELLASAGYSEAVIHAALRVSREEALDAYLGHEPARRDRTPRLRRTRVALAVGVAFAMGYVLIVLVAASVTIGPSPGLILFALAAFALLPAVAAGLVAAAGAGKRTARMALVALIPGLAAAMLAGWLSVSGSAVDEGVLIDLLIVTAVVAVPSIIGYGLGTSAAAS